MAISPEILTNILFKKLNGKGSTNDERKFFEEPYHGRSSILKDQIWTESDSIPNVAPIIAPDTISGVIQYKEDLLLTEVLGTDGKAFYSIDLKDAIPFNYDDNGSYNYIVKDNLNNVIPYSSGNWLVDGDAGLLTFYGEAPINLPLTITFYKYVGTKGVFTGGGGPGPGGSVLSIVDKGLNPNVTVGDDADTGLTISLTPLQASYIEVVVNGLSYVVGNGIKTESCYFEDPSTPGIARSFSGSNKVVAGDKLIWNGLINEFNLESDDIISIHYIE